MEAVCAQMARVSVKSDYEPSWWRIFELNMPANVDITTITLCIRMTGNAKKMHKALLQIDGASALEHIRRPEGVVKRGRKPKERGTFPNMAGPSVRVPIGNMSCVIKVFVNCTLQVCGCQSFDAVRALCALVHSMCRSLQPNSAVKSVDINNVSLITRVNQLDQSLMIGNDTKLSCVALSNWLNDNAPEFEPSDFHAQKRQTNLNLRYMDDTGRSHFVSVYPRGAIRITSLSVFAVNALIRILTKALVDMNAQGKLELL